MESANSHHHHHLQDQLVASSSPSSSSSSSSLTISSSNCYGLPSSTHANWTPTSFFSYPNEATTLSSHYNSMAPETGFTTWANTCTQNTFTGQDLQQQSRIKDEELADHYYRKYTEILSSTSPSSSSPDEHHNDLGTKLLLKSFSSGNLINKIHLSQDQDHLYSHNTIGAANNARGLCQIFPSVNVSSLNQTQGFASAGAFDMNLEAIDLLASSRFSANFVPSSHNQTGIFRDGFSFGFDHMQQSLQIPFYGSNNHKVSASSNAVVEPKRNCNKMEPKALIQNAPKKSRLEARSSCPPFKVRKEKLGDRIAALQQLVAPFGKTDTASVLMEAIGYIKFLQSQVETLSVPYMKASRNKPNRVMKGGPVENENEELKRDLRSRGLCLVPLSCLSYITDGGGAQPAWPPPHFGGAT